MTGFRICLWNRPGWVPWFLQGCAAFANWPTRSIAKHFFNELATLPHDDESHWMSLLEDLALIFRAKRLAFPDLPEGGEERRLLEFFEASEEWGDPETEVGSWYWKRLPERLSH